jgi:glycosyltransferase involved in cell wall biosynthesis
MAAGVAVVATSKEMSLDANALVPAKDPLAIAQRLISYLEDEEERRRAGRELQAAVREKFSLARMIDETEAIYRRVVGR